ncbi:alpha/beta hydrolase [Trichophyton equinum CBS 127.97]|uniref:Alpha/beta hydrolase n=1 Tax=Trichophyton equinum (strain ATCC MYA-4606 / CBS 127.97) TaxID=559882 RepID=F2PLM5_TRIEC|nr:alpha/beta hydrolase [Trichophyton equinum CBS 127.97]
MCLIKLQAFLQRMLRRFISNTQSDPEDTTDASEAPRCRFPLDDDSSDALTLPDGRKLGYAQYGLLTGKPIFYLHGLPGARTEAACFEDLARELGARIIAADRPGIGWSSPHAGRSLLDHPKDLEELANHLKLDKYGVLGISGGGPYALACAASLPPEKLKAVSIICGLGPPDIGMKGACWANWLGFTLGYRYFPMATGWYLKRQLAANLDLSDEKRYQRLRKEVFKSKSMPEKDREIMKDESTLRLFLRTSRQSFSQGNDAAVQDGRLMYMDFGFRVEDIRPGLPVQLWYGKQDVAVPLNHGVQIAARLGGRAALRVVDETHLSIWANYGEDALRELFRTQTRLQVINISYRIASDEPGLHISMSIPHPKKTEGDLLCGAVNPEANTVRRNTEISLPVEHGGKIAGAILSPEEVSLCTVVDFEDWAFDFVEAFAVLRFATFLEGIRLIIGDSPCQRGRRHC